MLGAVGATGFLVNYSSDFARNNERTSALLAEHTRSLAQHELRLAAAEERIRAMLPAQEYLRERVAYLAARRDEDDKITQADAIRAAENRAQLRNQIENLQNDLNRLTRDVAPYVPRREGVVPRPQEWHMPWPLVPLPRIEEARDERA